MTTPTSTPFEQAMLEARVRNLVRQLDSAKRNLKSATLEILKADLQRLLEERVHDKRLAEDCVRCLSEIQRGLVQTNDDISDIRDKIQITKEA